LGQGSRFGPPGKDPAERKEARMYVGLGTVLLIVVIILLLVLVF
jgi:hypothetical protein